MDADDDPYDSDNSSNQCVDPEELRACETFNFEVCILFRIFFRKFYSEVARNSP